MTRSEPLGMGEMIESGETLEWIDAVSRYRAPRLSSPKSEILERLIQTSSDLSLLREAPHDHSDTRSGMPNTSCISYPSSASILAKARELSASRSDPGTLAESAITNASRMHSLNVFTYLSGEARVSKELRGTPLFGIPFAVKDLIAVSGWPLTGGTRALPPGKQEDDAVAVRRLRQAGAIPIGLTNLHELAYGITNENPHFGTVANPWNKERVSGGSSGGAAVSVARDIVPLALGTDTSGSIRIPAACCGVVGFKPTFDLLSRDGVMPLSQSLDHLGVIAKSVTDTHAAMAALTGQIQQQSAPLGREKRKSLKLILPETYFFDLLEPSVRACLDAAFVTLAKCGVDLITRPIEDLEAAPAAQFVTIATEALEANKERLLRAPDRLGEDVRSRLEVGHFLLASDYFKAQILRSRLLQNFSNALANCDALITPTITVGAPAIGAKTVQIGSEHIPVYHAMSRCTLPFNLTGMPAITLPCGTDYQGLPVGLQIASMPGTDLHLLEVAKEVEEMLQFDLST